MTIPTPPRLTGQQSTDLAAVIEWAWGLYRELVLQNAEAVKLSRIGAVPRLEPDTATTPETAEAVNAIITAAKG